MKNQTTLTLTYAAICLALALVLPFLTGQLPQIGNALSPMHIPTFLCGFLCGWPYGVLIGFIAPLLRCFLFGMPPFLTALPMAFELATYGFIVGFMHKYLPKKTVYIYIALLSAMVCGRLVWGLVRFIIAGLSQTQFPLSAFWAGAVANAIPGIILHIILVPIIVMALNKAKVNPNAN